MHLVSWHKLANLDYYRPIGLLGDHDFVRNRVRLIEFLNQNVEAWFYLFFWNLLQLEIDIENPLFVDQFHIYVST